MTLLDKDEIDALLVFHANGTLNRQERDMVDLALARDPELADDLSLLQALRAEMQETPLPSAGALVQQRLMTAVAQTAQDEAPAPTARSTWSVTRLVAMLAVAAFVAQSVFVWRGTDAPGYELASSGAEGNLLVAFQPDATEAMIRETLLTLDLQIVSGPSSLGLYRLSSADPEAGEAALAAMNDVIESVESATD
jgi:hypothetical protein